MALNSTEGRTIIGFVVQGDDNSPDPQGLGRVKILTASNHPDTDVSKLPWSQVTSPASGSGPNAFNRPPPMGSVVEIFFPPGTKSSGHGIVRGVLHGVHNPDNLDNKKSGEQAQNFTRTGWLNEARNTRPKNGSGPAVHTQKNEDGKVTGETTYQQAPSLEDRVGTDTSGASKAFIRTNKGMTSVATASQWNYFMHDPKGITGQPTVELPGEDAKFADVVAQLSTGKELMTAGLKNMAKLRPEYLSDNTGMNFCYQGNKTKLGSAGPSAEASGLDAESFLNQYGISNPLDPAAQDITQQLATSILTGGLGGIASSFLTGGAASLLGGGFGSLFGGGGASGWLGNASEKFKSVTNQSELMDAIHEVNTWDFFDKALQEEPEKEVTFKGAFEKIEVKKKITPSGKITIENKGAIESESQKFNDKVVGGGVVTGKTTGPAKKGSDPDTGQPLVEVNSSGPNGGLFSGSGTKGPSGDLMLKLSLGTQAAIKKSFQEFASDPNQFAINFQFARFGAGEGCTRDPEPSSVSIA